jgi:biopolymer transport protein ExbD
MSKFKKKPAGPMELNLTAMMDVTFQLIIFFLLVNNMSAAELPKLEPPHPNKSVAQEPRERSRVVINVIPVSKGSSAVKSLRVGQANIAAGNYGELTQLLDREKAANPAIEVDLRADRNIHYTEVQPVMNAITGAGVGRINLVAFTDEQAAAAQLAN